MHRLRRLSAAARVALATALALAVPSVAAGRLSWTGPLGMGFHAGQQLSGIACPAVHQCTAVDIYGEQVTFDPSAPGSATPVAVDPGGYLTGLDCPSVSECVAVDLEGRAVVFDPTQAARGHVVLIDPGDPSGLDGIACPSVSECAAISYYGAEVTFNPEAPGNPRPATLGAGGFRAIACPAEAQCTIGLASSYEVTFDPRSPGTPAQVFIDSSFGDIFSLACPSTSQCTEVNNQGREVTFDPGHPRAASPVPVGQGTSLRQVACPSVTQCTAGDYEGREVTFDPQSSGQPITPQLIDRSVTTSNAGLLVACTTTTQCTSVDALGNEITFTPTAAGNPAAVPIDVGGNLHGVTCQSSHECTAISGIPLFYDPLDLEVTFDPLAVGRSVPHFVALGVMTGVACPSARLCSAVTRAGTERTFDPLRAGPANPPPFRQIEKLMLHLDESLSSVTCPSAVLCIAVGAGGHVVAFDPAMPGRARAHIVDRRANAPPAWLKSVACPTASQCTAVDRAGREVTFDPLTPGQPIPREIDAPNKLNSVVCPGVRLCVAAGVNGREITFNPLAPAHVISRLVDSAPISAIACLSQRYCVGVDPDGNAVAGDPSSGSSWVRSEIQGANSLTAIFCVSRAVCVAVDITGHAFVATPIARRPPPGRVAPSGVMTAAMPGIAAQEQPAPGQRG